MVLVQVSFTRKTTTGGLALNNNVVPDLVLVTPDNTTTVEEYGEYAFVVQAKCDSHQATLTVDTYSPSTMCSVHLHFYLVCVSVLTLSTRTIGLGHAR